MTETTGRPRVTSETIIVELREAILSGKLAPDSQLPTVAELSARYGVSLNTSRKALAVLASQGLLILRRGSTGGSFVTVPSNEQISESWQTSLALLAQNRHLPLPALLEIRDVLEVHAAEIAAHRRTEPDLEAMRAALFDPRTVDLNLASMRNRHFHTAVLRATQNPLFELVSEPVRKVIQDRFVREGAPAGFWEEVDRDHREILTYIEDGDQSGARDATRAHLRHLRSTYSRLDREGSGNVAPSLD